jgi:hypothetical protein
MNESLTLTYWRGPNDRFGRYLTRESAERFCGDGPVTEVAHTYRVGDSVTVRAFGRQRSGVVTGLGRTRLTVKFARNAAGEQDERHFGPTEVTPR